MEVGVEYCILEFLKGVASFSIFVTSDVSMGVVLIICFSEVWVGLALKDVDVGGVAGLLVF